MRFEHKMQRGLDRSMEARSSKVKRLVQQDSVRRNQKEYYEKSQERKMELWLAKQAKREMAEAQNYKHLKMENEHKLEEQKNMTVMKRQRADGILKDEGKLRAKQNRYWNKKDRQRVNKIAQTQQRRGMRSMLLREDFGMRKEQQEEHLTENKSLLKDFHSSILEKHSTYQGNNSMLSYR